MKLTLASSSCVLLLAAVAEGSKTLEFDRGDPTADLPLDHPSLQKSSFIEQVHVTGGRPDSVVITWNTNLTSHGKVTVCEAAAASDESADDATRHHQHHHQHLMLRGGMSKTCQTFTPTHEAYSFLVDAPTWVKPFESSCAGSSNYTNPDCYYDSGIVHTAKVRNFLKPGTAYTYTFEDDNDDQQFGFTTPKAPGKDVPITFAVVGDLGQTGNSSQTVDEIYARAVGPKKTADGVLFAGDLAYADGFPIRWDTYARLGQKLWANTVTSYTGGNHEVANGGENWANYRRRYQNDFDLSGSDSFLWYSFDTAAVHVISMCSYAGFGPTSLQYQWLQQDLASIDRTKTPWVVAMWHTPWYTSNAHHPRSEGAKMMDAMEDLIHGHVDIVFNGHVHAYERSNPVYKNQTTAAKDGGITYITIGDGGNREGYATPWVTPQPSWSAVREFAYGYGMLQVFNSSTAQWKWMRNDKSGTVGDEFVFRK